MFERKPLRADVQDEILARMVTGRIPPGARINESRLAAELGISRTPLREAMIGLQQRGFLVATMGRGFGVAPLSRRGIRDILDVLALLEPAAIQLAGRPAPALQVELGNVLSRAQLERPEAARAAQRFYEFHTILLRPCPNLQLRILGEHLNRHALRYLSAAIGAGLDPAPQWQTLAALLENLRRGELAAAGVQLAEYRREQADLIVANLPGDA